MRRLPRLGHSGTARALFIAIAASVAGATSVVACSSHDNDSSTSGDGGSNGGGGGSSNSSGDDGGSSSTNPGGEGTGPSGGMTADGGCVHGPLPSPDIYDEHCAFDKNAYVQIANSLSSKSGLDYRFGPDSTYFHATLIDVPTQPRVPVSLCGGVAIGGPPPQVLLYQIGNDCMINMPGNYSSDEGLVLYNSDVPLAPVDGGNGAGGGVDNIQIEVFAYNVFLYLPYASPDLGTNVYAGQLRNQSWIDLADGGVHAPIWSARGIAPSFGQTSQVGFVAFNDGVLGTIGTNTEQGGTVTSFPAHMVPTALGMTNGSEFLLATVWDTANIAGKLAVFAIESDHKGDGDFDDGIYDFHAHLAGFPSTGNATTIKLLGMIDLPGMIAPSDIAVASNYQSAFFFNGSSYASPATLDLTRQATWQTFTGTGVNSTRRSTGGFAVVSSRSERKVAFIDLQPLFDAFNAQYFTDFATFQSTQSNWGPAPDQWPFTFDNQPKAMPTVVSTVSLDEIPTTLFAGRTGQLDSSKGIHALVGTMDGNLHIYDVGGLIDSSAASASAIREIGNVEVGNNPTNIAIRKAGSASTSMPDPVSGSTGDLEGQQVFVTARGDRTIDFVSIVGGTGTVYKKLQDSRLIDPVSVDDADHESFSSYVLDIADLNGRQVVSYRYGEITLPQDMSKYPLPNGSDGKPAFEFGGSYAVQGTPFQVSGTNVP